MLHHRPLTRPAARERPVLEWNHSGTTTRELPRVEPDDPVGHAVLSALRAGVSRIVSRESEARSCAGEGVHRLRVATRRLRSELRALETLLNEDWRERVETELKWLAGLLGAVRDLDVLTARLRSAVQEVGQCGCEADALAPLFNDLEARHDRTSHELAEGLRSDRYRRLLKILDHAKDVPLNDDLPAEPCRTALPPVAACAWRRLAKAARKLRPTSPVLEFHAVRKRAKRARYTAELVAPFLAHHVSRDATRFIRATTQVQDLLGEHQDAVVAASEIERALTAHRDNADFTRAAERLLKTQETAAQAARDSFLKVWAKLDRKKLRRWLKT